MGSDRAGTPVSAQLARAIRLFVLQIGTLAGCSRREWSTLGFPGDGSFQLKIAMIPVMPKFLRDRIRVLGPCLSP